MFLVCVECCGVLDFCKKAFGSKLLRCALSREWPVSSDHRQGVSFFLWVFEQVNRKMGVG